MPTRKRLASLRLARSLRKKLSSFLRAGGSGDEVLEKRFVDELDIIIQRLERSREPLNWDSNLRFHLGKLVENAKFFFS